MRRFFITSNHSTPATPAKIRRRSYLEKLRSKRSNEYLHEQAVSLRHRVFLYLSIVILIYLIYLLFYSNAFKIKYLQVSGQSEIPIQEIEGVIWNSLNKNSWIIFPQDNYFLLSKKRLQRAFQKRYPLDDLVINKQSPHTLIVKLTERSGQFIWVTGERSYFFNSEGKIFKEIMAKELVNTGRPVIYDEANNTVNVNDQILSLPLINMIAELYQHLDKYEIPNIKITSFKINSSQANILKIITPQGFEIHLNTNLSLADQLYRLKRSLEAGKIDLNKVQYINLRIENQVIYK